MAASVRTDLICELTSGFPIVSVTAVLSFFKSWGGAPVSAVLTTLGLEGLTWAGFGLPGTPAGRTLVTRRRTGICSEGGEALERGWAA